MDAGACFTRTGDANMAGSLRNQNNMPDVPEMDFIGALCEVWFGLNCAAYHLAHVRVYLQTAVMRAALFISEVHALSGFPNPQASANGS
jgi:hypothetical protein